MSATREQSTTKLFLLEDSGTRTATAAAFHLLAHGAADQVTGPELEKESP